MEIVARSSAARDRAPVQDLELLVGLAFLVLGIAGFIPGITTHYGSLSFARHRSGAKLFGVFQTSLLQILLHLAFGLGGVALSRAPNTARGFLVFGGIAYLVVYGIATPNGSGANLVPL